MSRYSEIIGQAWQSHLKDKAPNAPTVISTFAGGGGSSLGYSMAGFRELYAVEWEQNAAEVLRLNFPGVPVHEGDICELKLKTIFEITGLKKGELDVFDGSPPCQGFSLAGKREMTDSRNFLFKEYARLLRGLRPKVFVMENVSGMVVGKMKKIFVEILMELKSCGYDVRAVLMNSMFFNVPQARKRIIFIGVRKDLGIGPSYPTHREKPISCSASTADLVIDQAERELLLEAGRKYRCYKYWHMIKPGQQEADITGVGFSATRYNPSKPANTITKTDGCISLHGAMHWSERRRFTVGEFKRFSSFPDEFAFIEGKRWGEPVKRIGNSVPPLFMRAIAEHIRREILENGIQQSRSGEAGP
jgi:DNA (cytosine-5)-methyltransferase 1